MMSQALRSQVPSAPIRSVVCDALVGGLDGAPGSWLWAWPSSSCYNHLGREPADGKPLSPCHFLTFLSVTLPFN